MDPYKVLDVPKDFTLEQLRANYKRVAIKVHPDKSGGSDYLFKMVTTCYKKLVKVYEARSQDAQFYELRRNAQRAQDGAQASLSRATGQQFNVKQFNKVFDEHKLPTEHDGGYSDWMETSSATRADIDVENRIGKFALDRFNRKFDEQPSSNKNGGGVVSKYHTPAPASVGTSLRVQELGTKKIDDYSGRNNSLLYTDYKVAHSTNKLVDNANKHVRKEYKSIDELEAERGKMRMVMSEKERVRYERAMQEKERQEQARQQALKEYDRLVEAQHLRLRNLLGH